MSPYGTEEEPVIEDDSGHKETVIEYSSSNNSREESRAESSPDRIVYRIITDREFTTFNTGTQETNSVDDDQDDDNREFEVI